MKTHFVRFVKSLTLGVAMVAVFMLCASEARAQTDVIATTLGCFGIGCTPTAIATFTSPDGAIITFTGQVVTSTTPSIVDLATFTVAGTGTFQNIPFTLQVIQTAPTAGTGTFVGVLSGGVVTDATPSSTAVIVFNPTPGFGSQTIVISPIRFQLVNLTNNTTLALDVGITRLSATITTVTNVIITPPITTPPVTAASVSVSGRVTVRGRGISNAVVHLTSQNGEILTTRTNRLGYYTFKELAAGETYIFNVFSKRYQFDSKVVNLTEDLAELDFSAR